MTCLADSICMHQSRRFLQEQLQGTSTPVKKKLPSTGAVGTPPASQLSSARPRQTHSQSPSCSLPGAVLMLCIPLQPACDLSRKLQPTPEESIAPQLLPRQEEFPALLRARFRAEVPSAALPCTGQRWRNPGWIKPKAWVSNKLGGEWAGTAEQVREIADLQIQLSRGAGTHTKVSHHSLSPFFLSL